MECEKIIQTFTPLLRKSLIDNMEPELRVRLHKFNSLRCIRQAYPCTVTYRVTFDWIITGYVLNNLNDMIKYS